MDALVGRAVAKLRRRRNVLMIISDHGFNSFRRGVDLNRWLEEPATSRCRNTVAARSTWPAIDWSQTRAFAVGLAGIFLNVKGRYSQGIVAPAGEAAVLREESPASSPS